MASLQLGVVHAASWEPSPHLMITYVGEITTRVKETSAVTVLMCFLIYMYIQHVYKYMCISIHVHMCISIRMCVFAHM